MFEENVKQLNEDGFTILRNVCPIEDINSLRELIEQKKTEKHADILKGGCLRKRVSKPGLGKTMVYHYVMSDNSFNILNKIFTFEKVVNFLKIMTDNQLKYAHQFSIQHGKGFAHRWHDDTQAYYQGAKYDKGHMEYKTGMITCPYNMHEPLPNGDTYKVYRVFQYLQDYTQSGGLNVELKSHLCPFIKPYIKNERKVTDMGFGDVIILDARTFHCSNVENTVDKALIVYTAGKDNAFLDYHTQGVLSRMRKVDLGSKFYRDKKDNFINESFEKTLSENGWKY